LSFDIVVEVFTSGILWEAVWSDVATFTLHGPNRPTERVGQAFRGCMQSLNATSFDAANSRAYSALIGDVNPVHIHPLLAHLFIWLRVRLAVCGSARSSV